MKTTPTVAPISHWRVLCRDIGEQAAADYISGQFARLGLQAVAQETFPCVTTWNESKRRTPA